MLPTMFLCAGMGTRLRPLTDELPKPMVPLGDRPVLSHLIESLGRRGGMPCAMNTHHLPQPLWDYARFSCPSLRIFHEIELRGTAGGVRGAISAFGGSPVMIWNSDILAEPDIPAMVCALERFPMVLSVELRPAGQGNVGLDGSSRVVRLRSQSTGDEQMGGYYTGILAMRPEVFDRLPERGCLIGDVAMRLIGSKRGIAAVPHTARWADIGTLAAYLEENLLWLKRQETNSLAWVHPDSSVGRGVRLRNALVGRGAVVDGSGELERVVVWPGTRCSAPLTNAIVTPRAGVVPVGSSGSSQ